MVRFASILIIFYLILTLSPAFAIFYDSYEYAYEFGSLGTGPGQFGADLGPRGIAVVGDYLYVADYGNQRIQKFTKDGQFVNAWSTGYIAQLYYKNGYLYALHPTGYISKYDLNCQLVDTVNVSLPSWAGAMAIDSDEHIQVSAWVPQIIHTFTLDLDEINQFYVPDGCNVLHCSPDGYIYFHTNNSQFAKYTNSGNDTGWRRPTNGESILYIDSDGYFATRAYGENMVKLYDPEWNLITTIGNEEGGSGPGEFMAINEMDVDEQGYLYITDGGVWGNGNYRVQVFRPVISTPTPILTPTPNFSPTPINVNNFNSLGLLILLTLFSLVIIKFSIRR